MCKQKHQQLTLVLRSQISFLKSRKNTKGKPQGLSIRGMARQLGIDHSVLLRELRRNSDENGDYDPEKSHQKAMIRKRKAASGHRKKTLETLKKQMNQILRKHSPEQTAGFNKENGFRGTSFSTVYRELAQDKKDGGKKYLKLRHTGKPYARAKKGEAGRGWIPGRRDISERPAIVEQKSRIGDIEADLIVGAGNQGYLVTLVDRKSKYLFIHEAEFKTKELISDLIIELLIPHKKHLHTISFDNGKEFADHKKIAQLLDLDCFFAKPYSSWERGLNEQTNGFIREYFPKGTIFLGINPKIIQNVAFEINSRPRKILKFKTPMEVFFNEIS